MNNSQSLETTWNEIDLGQVATLQRGYDLPSRLRKSGDVPVVTSTGVTDTHSESKEQAPGVVTGRYGTIGQVFYIKENYWPHNTTLFIKDFHGNDPLFVSYLLRTIDFHLHSGKSGVPGVNRNDLHALRIRIPVTIDEQRSIATALSEMDGLLGGLDRLIAKKHDLKQATIQQLLTGETRLPGFDSEWEIKNLGDLGHFLKGSGVRKDETRSGDLPCIRYGEIYTYHNDYIKSFNSWISPAVARTATMLKKNDILFAGSGETKAEIGKCVAFIDDFEAYAGGDTVILRPSNVNAIFLGYCCNTAPINLQKASKGQGDAVVHISANALASIELTIPDILEQTAIASILSDMDTEIAAIEQRRNKTRDLKQAMMQELLTGRIRLKIEA